MLATRYPKAVWKGDATTYGTRLTRYDGYDIPPRFITHTTETRGVPSYSGGTVAPTFTYVPRTREWLQHAFVGEVVGTLRGWSASGIPTNHANVIGQIEIVAYSSWWIAKALPGAVAVRDLTAAQLGDLAHLLGWLADEEWLSRPLVWSPGWTGTSQINEMTRHQWLSGQINGVAWNVSGHDQNPDASVHWDPDKLDRLAITRIANNGQPDMEAKVYQQGDEGAEVKRIQRRLNIHKADPQLTEDGKYGPKTAGAVEAFQGSKTFLTVTGRVDFMTWDELRRRPKLFGN